MERIIKFRAWDKNDEKMIYIDNPEEHPPYIRIQNYGDKNSVLVIGEEWEMKPSSTIHDIELMQFTGLLDKNGKEIFEGDIVKGGVYYGWEEEKGLGIIRFGEWEQDGSGQEYAGAHCLGWYIEILKCEYGDGMDSSLIEEETKHNFIEVVGNIFEDPELLSEGKERERED